MTCGKGVPRSTFMYAESHFGFTGPISTVIVNSIQKDIKEPSLTALV